MTDPEKKCPKFETCNAAICPLDDGWDRAAHLPGEPVCFYLRASRKDGAAERFRDDPTFAACAKRLPEVTGKHPDIRRSVEKAARSGFRGGHLIGKSRESR
jgi:hypothetical protein